MVTNTKFVLAQLEIYEMIGQAISNSRRAGGEVSAVFECYARLIYELN